MGTGKMPKFVGNAEQKVDAKGRVSIPSGFRKVIDIADAARVPGQRPTFYIAYGNTERPCLEGYTTAGLEDLHAKIDALEEGSEGRELAEDLYYTCVRDFQPDEEGRIVLPQDLREQLGLTGSAIFVGFGDRFEIWDAAAYRSVEMARSAELLKAKGKGYRPQSLFKKSPEQG